MANELMHDTLEKTAAIVGEGQDVIRELGRHGQHATVVAVVVPGEKAAFAAEAADALVQIINLAPQLVRERNDRELQAFLEIVLPKDVTSNLRLQEMAMVAAGRRAVLESGDFVTSAKIAAMANYSAKNPSAQPSKWKREGDIFAITHQNVDYFPSYGLDPDDGYKPLKRLKDILTVFDGRKDAWGTALWFLADNSHLDGRRPQDVLKDEPAAVLAAAKEEVSGVLHG